MTRRSTAATLYNSSSLVTVLFKQDEPGIWLDPSDVANLNWRRNLLTWTEQFDNAVWGRFGSPSVSAGTGFFTVSDAQTGATSFIQQAITLSGVHTASVVVRKQSGSGQTSRLALGDFSALGINFNAATGVFSHNATSGNMVSISDTEWIVTVSGTMAGNSLSIVPAFRPAGEESIHAPNNSATGSIDVVNAQLELGSSATEYQRITNVNAEVLEQFPKTTMFQDRTGTTPVTAPGQSVGLRLDKSKGTPAARRNLLTFTEQFDNAAWVKSGATISANAAVAPDGTSTADKLAEDTSTGVHRVLPNNGIVVPTGVTCTWSVYVKAAERTVVRVSNNNLAGVTFDLSNNASTSDVSSGITPTAVSVGNGWFRIAISGVAATGTERVVVQPVVGGNTSYTGVSGNGILIWGAQFELGSTATNYQRITTALSGEWTPGNHAVANSDAARGVYGIEPLGGRRNLLTHTEQFDNAAWAKAGVTVTQNAAVGPDGSSTADAIVEDTASSAHYVAAHSVTIGAVVPHTISVYAKADGRSWLRLFASQSGITPNSVWFNLTSGTVGTVLPGASNVTITNVGNGWYRCSVTFMPVTASTMTIGGYITQADGVSAYSGDGISRVLVWGAQLELGSTATNYQRVVSQYEVIEAGKPTLHYVQYDGVDDGYVTPTITPGTDKVQVFAGVRKLSDAAIGVVLESSVSAPINSGTLSVRAPQNTGANTLVLGSRGTITAEALASGFSAPITNVITGLGDISEDTATLRVNGTQVAQSTTDQGTGNYLAYPLYIGRRGGTSLPFYGRDYGLIVRFGSNLDAATISKMERLLARKTGVTL